MNQPLPPAAISLTEMGIPHQVFVHEKRLDSIEQAAEERGQSVDQIIRSIIFRLSEGNYAMVLAAGNRQISWKALRNHFGMSRLTMATAEEVLEVTGYRVGTVSPFGMKSNIPILADENIYAPEVVSMGSGISGTAILLTRENLRKALGPIEIGQFIER